MPNWCTNYLSVYGDKKEIERFIKDPFLDFNRIIPMPEELLEASSPTPPGHEKEAEDNIKKYGFPDWYTWAIHNWGTKWNVAKMDVDETCDAEIEEIEDDLIRVTFETAWGPSLPITKQLSKMFPTLLFHHAYDEPGMDFAGYITYKNEEEIGREEFQHSFSYIEEYMKPESYSLEDLLSSSGYKEE
jgi:hypothetical protein